MQSVKYMKNFFQNTAALRAKIVQKGGTFQLETPKEPKNYLIRKKVAKYTLWFLNNLDVSQIMTKKAIRGCSLMISCTEGGLQKVIFHY